MKPLSRETLISVGRCCGNGCLNCPYQPKHKKGSTKMSKEVIECERKWILWEEPHGSISPHKVIDLQYLYSPSGDRFQKGILAGKSPEYFKTVKTKVYDESGNKIKSSRIKSVTEISEGEFSNVVVRPDFYQLSKIRSIYHFGNYKAEIDRYPQHHLITLEVEKELSKEDPYWQHKAHIFESELLPFPKQIKTTILAEVTGREEFYNFNLALKLKKFSEVI